MNLMEKKLVYNWTSSMCVEDAYPPTSSVSAVISSWSPIGNSTTPFIGTYNGDRRAIYGFFLNNTYEEYQGLFGKVGNTTTGKVPLCQEPDFGECGSIRY